MSLFVKNGPNKRDIALAVATALPAAAATNYSAALDLGAVAPQVRPQFELELVLPATPALVDAKTITLTIQDSDDNITFANLPISTTLTGAGGVGAAALALRIGIPSTARRYLRVAQTVLAAGGDNTGVSSTLAAVFWD